MQKRICIIVFTLFFLIILEFRYTNVLYAQDNNAEQVEIENTNSFFVEKIKDNIQFVFVVIAGIVSVINLYNFFVKNNYEIGKLKMEIIYAIEDEMELFECEEIVYQGDSLIDNWKESPFFLKVIIEVVVPENRKKIRYLYIKNLRLFFNDNQFKYEAIKRNFMNIKKLRIDEQKKECAFILKYPLFKEKEARNNLNPVSNLESPQDIHIEFRYGLGSLFRRFWRLMFSKPSKVRFEKDCEKIDRTAVISRSIL